MSVPLSTSTPSSFHCFIGSKVVHLLLPFKPNLFLCPCVCLYMSVCMSVTLKHTVVLHLSFSLSLSMALSFSVQSVQIELAGYDASGILISSNLHLDNGRSWEATFLLFFLSFPLLELPIPLSCPPFCFCVYVTAPNLPPLLCFWEEGCLERQEIKDGVGASVTVD